MKKHAPRLLFACLAFLFVFTTSGNKANSNLVLKPLTTTSADFACPFPAWSASQVYTAGQKVKYNGHAWEARWWTQGDTPGASIAWLDLGACPD